jgi:crotonobetainyl-CoA:carnitine CoA-transferase CaiB-like acyl-CoA transferase
VVDGVSHLWEFANRGKRAIALDLSTPDGHEILMRLIDEADVFLTNFLPSARRKLGIEPEDIMGRNPRIIYGRGSAQGPRGEQSERGGFDGISYWARSGASVGVTPPEHAVPLSMPGPGFGDVQTGVAMAGAISAALYRRERTGQGTLVDVSLMSMGLWAMGMTISGTSVLDADTLPHQYHDQSANPVTNSYRTKDGYFVALAFLQADRYWPEFCVLVDKYDWLADERFTDAPARNKNREACVALLDELFAERTLAEWVETLSQQEGQWDVVGTPGLVKYDPQVVANGYVQRVEHDGQGKVDLVASPAQFDGRIPKLGKAPTLGGNTDEILAAQGLDAGEIAALRERGIVG